MKIAAASLIPSLALGQGQAFPLVNVTFITEAGCPPCQEAITGTVNSVVQADGVAGIMNMNQIPFGNNYFETKACGGAPYDPNVRHCWAAKCVASSQPAADCFQGTVVTQHGPNELNVNKMEACAKNLVPTWQDYWPFLVCMEKNYEMGKYIDAMPGCVASSKLPTTAAQLTKCYSSQQGMDFLVREAKQTIDHPGTPTMIVGQNMLNDIDAMLTAVCAAYTGPKPPGCSVMEAKPKQCL